MIKQECIGIPDMILLIMIFLFKKIKIKAEIILSPGGAYFLKNCPYDSNEIFYSHRIFYTVLGSYVCNGIKLVSLVSEKDSQN